MEQIVVLDDTIRAELTGSKIGKAKAPEDKISAKELIKSARSHFNRREYMPGIAALSHFRKKMILVIQAIKSIDTASFGLDFEKIHHRCLFDEFPEESLEQLKQNVQLKAELNNESIVKEAGIFDVVHNVATSKGRALAAWEKQNLKATEKLKKGGLRIIDSAQELLSKILSDLKTMAHFRAVRNPQEYMKTANDVVSQFNEFDGGDKGFNSYYTNVVDPFIKKHEEFVAAEKAQQEAVQMKIQEEMAKQNEQNPIPTVSIPAPPAPPTPPKNVPTMPGDSLTAPVPQFTAELAPPTPKPAPRPEQLPLEFVDENAEIHKVQHQNFFNSLKTLGSDDPNVLEHHILKYAKSIQSTDLEMAISLFNVVKKIRG
jgi:hypothetical protein